MRVLQNFAIIVPLFVLAFVSSARADLVPGLLHDFQDGTVQGWDGGTVLNIADSGPGGVGDHSLQLSNGGVANRFAMFNLAVNGIISSNVRQINADILRPAGSSDAEIRLVLFDTVGNRWTSSAANLIPGNGTWGTYSFSILEADLVQVVGVGTYSNLVNNLERIMFRYDPGAPGSPNAGGFSLPGTMNFDNISAVPEPTFPAALIVGLMAALGRRRR